jgi:hypothetical protein
MKLWYSCGVSFMLNPNWILPFLTGYGSTWLCLCVCSLWTRSMDAISLYFWWTLLTLMTAHKRFITSAASQKLKERIEARSLGQDRLQHVGRIVHYLMGTSFVLLLMISSNSPSCQACANPSPTCLHSAALHCTALMHCLVPQTFSDHLIYIALL